MNKQFATLPMSLRMFAIGIFLIATTAAAGATTYVIKFGGSLGDAYSPSVLQVAVGDTVQWQGSFSFHPLKSLVVPAEAAAFSDSTGTVFSYPVTVAGTYTYECTHHVTLGMAGVFTTLSLSGVAENSPSGNPAGFKLAQNYPNPFNPSTVISFTIPSPGLVTLKVYNLIGQEMATIVDGTMEGGTYSKSWNASSLPSGVYFYQLKAGAFTATKKLQVLK